jgi:hypothetical protein
LIFGRGGTESQVTQSPHDVVSVELVEPDDMPSIVKISMPLQPTVIDPPRFGDIAAVLVKLFSEAHVTLASIRAWRKL